MSKIGLVLGAGGLPGEAFHRGVLRALRDVTGLDARTADTVVGTSAGSLVAAAIRSPETRADAAVPPPGSTRLPPLPDPRGVLRSLRRPWPVRPGVLAAALLPPGRHGTGFLRAAVHHRHGSRWPDRRTWIVATRRGDGRRVVFGRPGTSPVEMSQAVAASCAIPGYFRPVVIDGEAYVDGFCRSPNNADLLADTDVDIAVISAPMSVRMHALRVSPDLPFRVAWRGQLAGECRTLHEACTRTLVFAPGGATLKAFGVNPLNAGRIDEIEELAYHDAAQQLWRSDVAETLGATVRKAG